MIDSNISHEKFTLLINEEMIYAERKKESIRTKDSQLADIERDRLTENGKSIGIDVSSVQFGGINKFCLLGQLWAWRC